VIHSVPEPAEVCAREAVEFRHSDNATRRKVRRLAEISAELFGGNASVIGLLIERLLTR
jgi:hypothetical protein